jgi:hypothetical protein
MQQNDQSGTEMHATAALTATEHLSFGGSNVERCRRGHPRLESAPGGIGSEAVAIRGVDCRTADVEFGRALANVRPNSAF